MLTLLARAISTETREKVGNIPCFLVCIFEGILVLYPYPINVDLLPHTHNCFATLNFETN